MNHRRRPTPPERPHATNRSRSASKSSKAKVASAFVKNASMASSRSRKLAVSSTRYSSSATFLGGLSDGATRAALLELGDGSVGPVGAAGLNVGQAALRVVNQQQVDALSLQPVVVVQPVSVYQGDVAFTVLGDDLLAALGTNFLAKLRQLRSGMAQ